MARAVIPRKAHFVFGLREPSEPFPFLHYVALESCRRVLEPEEILFHHKHLPWGGWWERIRPFLTLVEVEEADEVLAADYRAGGVPAEYRYAHHADFVRLDALIEHGGVYADIDTIFLRPFPETWFERAFVIGREAPVLDPKSGIARPSLCNALLMSRPGSEFARRWRADMPAALDGSWSNHSGFLPERLSRSMGDSVRVEPETSFFAVPCTPPGLRGLLEGHVELPGTARTLHLWAHLWWSRHRTDFARAHAGWCEPDVLAGGSSTLATLVRPYLPRRRARPAEAERPDVGRLEYLSLDEFSGYATAAKRCRAALVEAGVEVHWTPFVPGHGWGLGYEPALPVDGPEATLVAHLVPEYLPLIRERSPASFLVAHTVWDTDRIPDHWIPCLEQADLIVVPSHFSARPISASPVTRPVEVIPHIAPALDEPGPLRAPNIPDDVFVFYTIGDWSERKGVARTIEAYLRAFRRDEGVLLVVKTSAVEHGRRLESPHPLAAGTTARAVAEILGRHPGGPPVRLVTREMTDAQVAALHRRGDCFVSLCRSEGFGLGAFDAAAFGNPVVMTGFGGQLDFLGGSPFLVGYDLVPVVDPVGFPSYAPDQRWAQPHADHAAELMRAVRRDPRAARAAAAALATELHARFGPQHVAGSFTAALARHNPGTPTAARAAADRRA